MAGSTEAVFLHPSDGQSQAVAALRDYGGEGTHTYDNFSFIAGRVPADNRHELAQDNRVAKSEDDGTVEALHHQEGQDGGPPGGGDGDGCGDHPAQKVSWGWIRISAHPAN